MKILFLTDGIFPFQLGGMQKHSLMLIQQFADRGIDLRVVHCGGLNYSTESFQGLFSQEQQKHISETYIKFPKTDPFPGHYIRESKAYSKNAYFELESDLHSFDLIYAQGFTAWHFIKEKHRKQFNFPITVNFHGLEVFQTAPSLKVMAEYTLLKNSVKWNLRNADYVYSFGGQIDAIINALGVHTDRILQQSNGIEVSWWVEKNEVKNNQPRRFIFIGRSERRKGIEELNKVLEQFIKQEVKFEFTFIGPIEEKLQIKSDRIRYLGEIREQELVKANLIEHDCLVCPSHAEGMPTVLLEAMACGLAVVATNVGAVSRLIDRNGILIEKPEVKSLACAIQSIVDMDEDSLAKCKLRSKEIVKDAYFWPQIIDQKVTDFERCMANNQLLKK
jgi:glycosyltransferase involved in cell wall biosynthesis